MEERILELLSLEQQSKAAFELIVNGYSERLYWHIRRIVGRHEDADDVLQNTFVKIWKHLASFRRDSKLFSWMYRIATNEALDHIRKNKRYQSVESDFFGLGHAEPYVDGNTTEALLYEAIAELPEKQRLVFNLKYFEEMKYEDMAEVTGTSVGALKTSYHLAVKKIKESVSKGINPLKK